MNVAVHELRKRQNLQHRHSLLRFVAITVGGALAIYGVNHWGKKVTTMGEPKVHDWVSLQMPKEDQTNSALVKTAVPPTEGKTSGEPDLAFYADRPGFVESAPDPAHFKVKYELESEDRKIFSDARRRKLTSASVAVPRAWLKKCPPGQEDIDSSFEGVMRVWADPDAKPPGKQTVNAAKVDDKITVEVKDFDRWLFVQMDYGRFKEDINDVPENLRPYVDKAVSARRAVKLFSAVNHANQLLRIELRSGKKATRDEGWATLEKMITQDALLSEIMAGAKEPGADPAKPAIDWTVEEGETGMGREAELLKIDRRIGPLKVWFFKFTEKRFQQLTLSLNGVILRGLTPRNAYNEADVGHPIRPSFRDDTYHWIRFSLDRRAVKGEAGEANSEDAANAAAWARLLARPKLRDPMRVTLALPEPGLELRTKVTPEAPADTQFFLIGIREKVLYATVVAFVCLLGFLAWLARTTNILRESSGRLRPDGVEPVSLAKTQMAFWFILTASAFAYLWVTTSNIDTINKTCLVLLGIGTGTALGAALIPSSRDSGKAGRNYLVQTSLFHTRAEVAAVIRAAIVERVRLLWRKTKETDAEPRRALVELLRLVASPEQWSMLAADLGLAEGEKGSGETPSNLAVATAVARCVEALRTPESGPEIAPLLDELMLLGKQLKDFEGMERKAWKRLFSDLLNEDAAGGSYEFHRFQMLGWTLLLGLVFIVKLLNDHAMPEFGDTTLALLGISGGTYLGFKLPAVKGTEARKEDAPG